MEFKVLYGFYILQNNAYNRQYFILLVIENQRKKLGKRLHRKNKIKKANNILFDKH